MARGEASPQEAQSQRAQHKLQSCRVVREACRRVRHDSRFSEWKVLVGANDWAAHSAGVEGAQRYRIHNLPPADAGAGVYELGLIKSRTASTLPSSPAVSSRRLKSTRVVPVYVGQAENVRQRLQQYGKDGSHLGSGKQQQQEQQQETALMQQHAALLQQQAAFLLQHQQKAKQPHTHTASSPVIEAGTRTLASCGLFEAAFKCGFAIVFRWSKVATKAEAEAAEAALLSAFDYPWNVRLNGARRPHNVPTAVAQRLAMTRRVAAAFNDYALAAVPPPLRRPPPGPSIPILQKPVPIGPRGSALQPFSSSSSSPFPPSSCLRVEGTSCLPPVFVVFGEATSPAPGSQQMSPAAAAKSGKVHTTLPLEQLGVRTPDGLAQQTNAAAAAAWASKAPTGGHWASANSESAAATHQRTSCRSTQQQKASRAHGCSSKEEDAATPCTRQQQCLGDAPLEELPAPGTSADRRRRKEPQELSHKLPSPPPPPSPPPAAAAPALPEQKQQQRQRTQTSIPVRMCGASLAAGGVCCAEPVKGRQRCAEHKGKHAAKVVA